MLRFFRHLRNNLIEQKKISSYLLYALGEIFLLVIGILIALQINNWNEQRKQQVKEQDYLSEIIINLEEDLIDIQYVRTFNIRKDSVIQILLSQFSGDHTEVELRTTIIENLSSSLSSFQTFKKNRAAYDNLVGSENLSLIQSDSLRNMIYKYYESDDFITFGTQQRLQNKNRDFLDYTAPYLVTREALYQFTGETNEMPSMSEHRLRADPKLMTIIFDMENLISAQNRLITSHETSAIALIEYIKTNLNTP